MSNVVSIKTAKRYVPTMGEAFLIDIKRLREKDINLRKSLQSHKPSGKLAFPISNTISFKLIRSQQL